MTQKLGSKPLHPRQVSRRQTLRWVGSTLAVAPLTAIFGCEDPSVPDVLGAGGATAGNEAAGSSGQLAAAGAAGTAGKTAAGSGGAGTAGQTAVVDDADGGAATGSASVWATGGTAALTALASYPDPFSTETASSCTLFCQATEGPCHDDQAPEREDISEGQGGLPMRFGLRILDDKCQPITDADVDIWHCDVRGIYSSGTSDNPGFCTGDDAAALAARYFRGHRMTDTRGIVWFSSVFPGWYNGRAIHIHFTVRRSNRDGTEYLTSQVGFQQSLIQELCTTHPDYESHGLPNTANTADTVFPAASVDDYMLDTQRMSDGAMLAYKTIIIRSNVGDSVCGASNMGGPGGPGGMMMGPPPGFGGAGGMPSM